MPRAIITEQGAHFDGRSSDTRFNMNSIIHRLATPYPPQTSGQLEVSNHQIHQILEKTVIKKGRLDGSIN